eukprot:500590-Rhodomonas_salina.2
MSGTDIAHATGSVPPPYAMSGTYIGHMLLSYASAMRCPPLSAYASVMRCLVLAQRMLRDVRYPHSAMSGTEIAHATRCPFVDPLFSPSAVDREKNAVDSEYR